MTAPWRKVVRDFWEERTRTVLVVLAIAVGLSGFASVLSSYAILDRELDQGYRATNPASATFRTDAVDDDLLQAIRAVPGVTDAQARRVVSGRVRTSSGEWRAVTLFAVADYAHLRIARVTPERGSWPPGAGEILVERDAFSVAGAQIGGSLTVKTLRGEARALRVAGSVHDAGQAQARMENSVYGYVAPETLASLGEEPAPDQLQIVVGGAGADTKRVRAVASAVQARIESRGHPVRRTDVPTPGRHPHADIMGLLLLAIAGFGLAVLLLSGILVINLLTAMMASQTRQIGVMKAVGGTRAQIAAVYLAQALLIGIAAILLAIPVGVAGSRLFCRSMAVLLNFDITSFAVPVWIYGLVAAGGLGVPLLAAVYPVWRASGVTIREALSERAAAGDAFGKSPLDRAVARVGGRARPLLLALRNTVRRRGRLALTLATFGAAGLFFLAALNVRASMIRTLDRSFAAKKFDLTVGLGGVYPLDPIERAVRATPGIRRVEGWITTEGSIPSARAPMRPAASASSASHAAPRPEESRHSGANLGPDRFVAVALPPATELLALEIVEGRGLHPGDTNAVVVNTALAARPPRIRVGDLVPLQMGHVPTPWRVVGIAREAFSPPVAYVPLGHLRQLGGMGEMTNSLRVALTRADPASIRRVRAALEQNLEREGVRVAGMLSKADSRFGFDQHMVMIYVALIVLSCVVGGVGALGIMTTMSLNVLERRREMGVLRAIGATPRAVLLIVVAEGTAIGLASGCLAALAAWPVSRGIGDLLVGRLFAARLDFAFEPAGVAIWAAGSLFTGVAASFLPAWRASRFPIRRALDYE